MLRMAFLIVVVLGALGIVLSLIVGAGVFRAARLRAASTTPATPPVATPSRPGAPSPAADGAASTAAVHQQPNAEAAKKPAVPAPAAVNAAPIILLAKDAELHGDDFRLTGEGDAKTVVNWFNRFEVLEWVATIPKSGEYEVVLEYSADPAEGGGAAEIMFGAWPRGLLTVMPTASWDEIKLAKVRTMLIPEGKTSVILRPYYVIPGRQLMHLRSIRLTLLREIEMPTMPERGRMRFRRGF